MRATATVPRRRLLLNLLLDRALVGPLAPADALREARRALDMPPLASRARAAAES